MIILYFDIKLHIHLSKKKSNNRGDNTDSNSSNPSLSKKNDTNIEDIINTRPEERQKKNTKNCIVSLIENTMTVIFPGDVSWWKFPGDVSW